MKKNVVLTTRTSTHTGKVINHIYPNVDRTVGIELTVIHELDYASNLLQGLPRKTNKIFKNPKSDKYASQVGKTSESHAFVG